MGKCKDFNDFKKEVITILSKDPSFRKECEVLEALQGGVACGVAKPLPSVLNPFAAFNISSSEINTIRFFNSSNMTAPDLLMVEFNDFLDEEFKKRFEEGKTDSSYISKLVYEAVASIKKKLKKRKNKQADATEN